MIRLTGFAGIVALGAGLSAFGPQAWARGPFSNGPFDANPPYFAAPSCEALSTDPALPPFWLGHFQGGRFLPVAGVRTLDWRDEKTCFASRTSCDRWLRDNRRVFSRVEGYTTCLAIRPPGRRLVRQVVLRRRY